MNLLQRILVVGIAGYRRVGSPLKTAWFGAMGWCRYWPSCSHYALEAVLRHGALRGSALAVRRLCRCHRWGGWGFDPVPSRSCEPVRMEGAERAIPELRLNAAAPAPPAPQECVGAPAGADPLAVG